MECEKDAGRGQDQADRQHAGDVPHLPARAGRGPPRARSATCPDCGGAARRRACPKCHTALPIDFVGSKSPMIGLVGVEGQRQDGADDRPGQAAAGGHRAALRRGHQDRHRQPRRPAGAQRLPGEPGDSRCTASARCPHGTSQLQSPAVRHADRAALAAGGRPASSAPSLKSTMLSFVDSAGEDLNDLETAFTLQYLSVCDSLIITLDPFALPGARARLKLPEGGDSGRRRRPARRRRPHHPDPAHRARGQEQQEDQDPGRDRVHQDRRVLPDAGPAEPDHGDRRPPSRATTRPTARPSTSTCGRCCGEWDADDIDRTCGTTTPTTATSACPRSAPSRTTRSARSAAGRGAAAPGRGPGAVAAVQGRNGAIGMTAAAFDRLLYTDCRPVTGRGAGGGFQVQAQSAGVDPAQSAHGGRLAAVRGAERVGRAAAPGRGLPARVRARSGPAATGRRRAATSGKEATGGRQGNHLADCLLTRDPDLYGTIRPGAAVAVAALAGRALGDAPTARRSTTTSSLGPLTLDAVTDWVRGPPGARPRSWPGCSACSRIAAGQPGRDRLGRRRRGDELDRGGDAAAAGAAGARRLVQGVQREPAARRAARRGRAADLNPQLAPGPPAAVHPRRRGCAADDAAGSERAASWSDTADRRQ